VESVVEVKMVLVNVDAIDTDLHRGSQVGLERGVIQEDRPRFLGRVDSEDEAIARICSEEYARSSRYGCQTIEKLGGSNVDDFLDRRETAVLAATIEVQAPRAPAAGGSKAGTVAEVANVLSCSVSNELWYFARKRYLLLQKRRTHTRRFPVRCRRFRTRVQARRNGCLDRFAKLEVH
jgi:hypothetical protein